jgi:hypothetical protein
MANPFLAPDMIAKPAPAAGGNLFRAPGMRAPRGPTMGDLMQPGRDAITGDWFDQIAQAIEGFPAAARAAQQQHAGQSFAQRVTDPQELGRAIMTALSFGPGNIGSESSVLGARPKIVPSPSAATQRLAEFDEAGVTPNLPAVGGSRPAALVAKMAASVPFAGKPVQQAFNRTLADIQAAVERTAGKLGTAATPEDAGTTAREGILRWITQASKKTAGDAYDKFWALMHGAPHTTLPNTLATLRRLNSQFPNAPGLSKTLGNKTLMQLEQDLTGTIQSSGGVWRVARKLSIPEIKNFVARIGSMLDGPQTAESISRGELKQIYAALKQDLTAAASRRSPAALHALQLADRYYSMRVAMKDSLDPLLRPDAVEKTFNDINRAAQKTGTGGNVGLLWKAKRAMTPQEWGDVGAAILRRLGHPSPGAHSPNGIDFSTTTFVSNWNKLTGQAKDLLFGPDEPNSVRAGLERLVRLAKAQDRVAKLENVSRSGEYVLMGSIIDRVLSALAKGGALGGAKVGGVFGGGYLVSKVLMSPGFARWLYQLPRAVRGLPPSAAEATAVSLLNLALRGAASGTAPQSKPPRIGGPGQQGGTITGIGAGAL